MNRVLHIPEPGQLVDVRHRRYVVVEVTSSTLPPRRRLGIPGYDADSRWRRRGGVSYSLSYDDPF